jgi:predicted HicB family RNase H-like nuclease
MEKQMRKLIEYNGYVAEFGLDSHNGLYGHVLGLKKSVITFEGETVDEMIADFHDVIEEYLSDCAEEHMMPEQPYKGSLNVRIGHERHRMLAQAADAQQTSINKLIVQAIDEYCGKVAAALPSA